MHSTKVKMVVQLGTMTNKKNDIGNRPFYYSEIYVDPENENRVYSIYTYVNVSEDGGKNFKQLNACLWC